MSKILALVLALLTALPAFPRAGGGASVGRAAPAPAPARIAAPAPRAPTAVPTPRYVPPAPRTVTQQTTVVNAGGGGGSGFGSSMAGSFVGAAAGTVVGNALSRPAGVAAGVPVATTAAVPVAAVAATPAVAANGEPVVQQYAAPVMTVVSPGFPWSTFAWLVFGLALLAFLMWAISRMFRFAGDPFEHPYASGYEPPPEPVFDPLLTFYRVQQAAMDDDRATLARLCTAGMAEALSGAPEPGRVARASLTAVVHSNWARRSVLYVFNDRGIQAREIWQFTEDWKLEGIDVQPEAAV